MANVRVTIDIVQYAQSVSESYWLPKNSSDLSTYGTVADRLAQKRIKLCGAQGYLLAYRVSEEGVFRDGYTFHYPLPAIITGGSTSGSTSSPIYGTSGQNSDAIDTTLIIRARNADYTRWKTIFLRGIWDAVVDQGGRYLTVPAFDSLLKAWSRQLFNDGWGWLGVGTRRVANVATVTQGPTNRPAITFDADIFPTPVAPVKNVQVRFTGLAGATQINGLKLVTPTATNACTLAKPLLFFPYLGGGRATYSPKDTFIPIADATSVSGVGERKAGRVPFVPPGRQKVRAAS